MGVGPLAIYLPLHIFDCYIYLMVIFVRYFVYTKWYRPVQPYTNEVCSQADSFGRLAFCLSVVKDSCEQSGVNTIESLQGFHPLYIGEFWPPFIRAMLFQLSYCKYTYTH